MSKAKPTKAKALHPWESKNAEFMEALYKERLHALEHERARYAAKLKLKASVERRVQLAKNSVTRKHYNDSKKRNNSLKRKFRNIHGTLKTAREYAMHVSEKGDVTNVQPPSFVNIIERKQIILSFNDPKSFKINPKATVRRKNSNPPPETWKQADPYTEPEYDISVDLLDGKVGEYKLPVGQDRKLNFLKEGSTVIVGKENQKPHVIKGVFKDYPAAMIEHHPALAFCSEEKWKSAGLLLDL